MSGSGTFSVTFTGIIGPGTISVSGLEVGDVLLSAVDTTEASFVTSDFAPIITTAGEVSQANLDLAGDSITAIFYRSLP